MYSFTDLKLNLKKDFTGFKKIRVAVLGDSSTQFLVQALKGYAFTCRLELEVFEGDFNQIEGQVYGTNSELYQFGPQIVIIFYASENLVTRFQKMEDLQKSTFGERFIENIDAIYHVIQRELRSKVICYNLPEINNGVFGNYGNKTKNSNIYQLRKINLGLMELAQNLSDLHICDISTLQNQMGRKSAFAPNIYVNTGAVFSLDFVPYVAKHTLDIIRALSGAVVKCIVLDLDDTLWGGVIGDDGIEHIQLGELGIGKAFTEFQLWIKALKQRGIIIAICSKNNEESARQVFLEHPDMVLKMEDIALFVANWKHKVDNIRHIQSVLNIGFDTMVYLDDNPFERDMVREAIPEIIVPQLPEDAAEFLEFLYEQNLFETASYSEEDSKRTEKYQLEVIRTNIRETYADADSFLESLLMQAEVQEFNKFNTPRVAQLSHRSNQFNLRTVRYTESDIRRIAGDSNYKTFAFTLEDKYGNNGIVCLIILRKESTSVLFIDTWLMSCRVLKRGMESFVLNTIVAYASAHGYRTIKGEYLPTERNGIVREHYKTMGFEELDGYWYKDVAAYKDLPCFITEKKTIAIGE